MNCALTIAIAKWFASIRVPITRSFFIPIRWLNIIPKMGVKDTKYDIITTITKTYMKNRMLLDQIITLVEHIVNIANWNIVIVLLIEAVESIA